VHLARSVSGGIRVAISHDDLDELAQPANRAAVPGRCDSSALITIERSYPPRIETTIASEIGEDGRQQGIEMVARGEGHFDDSQTVEQGKGQTGYVVGRSKVANLAEVHEILKQGIQVTLAGLTFQHAEKAMPQRRDRFRVAGSGDSVRTHSSSGFIDLVK